MKKSIVCALLCSLLAACQEAPRDFYSGYAEADYVRLASPVGGTLTRVYVQRGDQIKRDAPAFVLEQESEKAARAEAQARLERAQASLLNLQSGKRPDEVAVISAQAAQAEAALKLSQADLAREQKLLDAKFIAAARIDTLSAAVARDRARVGELQAALRVAKLSARSAEQDAARDDIQAAQAQLAQADWKLAQKSLKAPLAAQVADVLYREGELVPAGAPVVSLLAPENVRARFFVPQHVLGTLKLGAAVSLQCDGCKGPIAATISFISPEAEFTAPLIYSKENRDNLVFMIEARPAPDGAALLHPGQPLEIRLAQAAPH